MAPPTHSAAADPRRPGRTALGWVAAIGCWAAALAFFWWQSGIWASASLDVGIYREAAAELLAGGDVYDGSYGATGLPFTYPPFGLLLLVPLAVIPQAAAGAVMFAGSAAALVGCLRLAGQYAWPGRFLPWWAATVAAAFVAVVVEPVRVTLGLGQINLLILVVILALDAGARQRVRGIGAGVGAAVKVTPALLVAAQLGRGDLRAFLRGVAAFAACTLVAALVLPAATGRYFTGLLWESDRPGTLAYAGNQSLRGMVERIVPGSTAAWLITVVAVLALAAVGVHRHRSDPWLALTVAAVAGLLISPVSWSHHWVWVLPVAAVSARYWRRRPWLAWSGVVLVAATSLLTGPAVGLDYSWLAALWAPAGENAYVLAALVWLGAAGWPVRRTAPPPP